MFPFELRFIQVMPIPKAGKHLNDLSNLRLISPISVFITNFMVAERLMDFLNSENIIPAPVLIKNVHLRTCVSMHCIF